MNDSLKIRLLKAVGNDAAMRAVLIDLLDRTQGEFCAFYTAREREIVHIMCESRELARFAPEIREKTRASYRMFTNGFEPESEPIERIHVRKEGSNVAYLIGRRGIESYFLVPLSFGSRVRGVLFFGSVRREAFGRAEIAAMRSLAEEGEERDALVFRVGGEREIYVRLLEALPFGAAFVAPDGAIVSANAAFSRVLGIGSGAPESVFVIDRETPFSLHGLWEEWNVLQRDVVDRELAGSGSAPRYLSVSWVAVEGLAEEIGSMVIVKDATAAREQAEMREEMIAMVAHELRTPLAALKSSLGIVADASPAGDRSAEGEAGSPAGFIVNSLRTVDRLGRLVDGLIDSSSARIDDRPLRIERREVRPFLEESSSLFREPMRRKGIAFRIFVDPDAARLAFDRDRLEQVVQNLLANSMKHVPSGESISITVVPCVACPAQSLPRALARRLEPLVFADLCVRDTGAGIPAEIARRMNESPGTVDRPIRGAKGLGLVLAQRLIRLQGGTLVVEEGVAGGSAVHLYLPADERSARIVQQYRAAGMRLEEMLSRGLAPAVYAIVKDAPEPWDAVWSRMRPRPIVNPARGESSAGALLAWPLDARAAVALAERERVTGGEVARIGTARARRDGNTIGELLAVAFESIDETAAVAAAKGETE